MAREEHLVVDCVPTSPVKDIGQSKSEEIPLPVRYRYTQDVNYHVSGKVIASVLKALTKNQLKKKLSTELTLINRKQMYAIYEEDKFVSFTLKI